MVDTNRLMLAIGAGLAPKGGGLQILRSMDEAEDKEAARKEAIKLKGLLMLAEMPNLDDESRGIVETELSKSGLIPEGVKLPSIGDEPIGGDIVTLIDKEGNERDIQKGDPRITEMLDQGFRQAKDSADTLKGPVLKLRMNDGTIRFMKQNDPELAKTLPNVAEILQRPSAGQKRTLNDFVLEKVEKRARGEKLTPDEEAGVLMAQRVGAVEQILRSGLGLSIPQSDPTGIAAGSEAGLNPEESQQYFEAFGAQTDEDRQLLMDELINDAAASGRTPSQELQVVLEALQSRQ